MNSDFNLENWPIVYFKIDSNKLDEEYFDEYRKFYLNLLIKCKRNNEKMLLICNLNDLNNYGNFDMKFMMKQAKFSQEIYKFNKLYLTCVCILCKNKSFKNMLNIFFTIVKQAAPYKLCRTSQKANLYLKEKHNIDFDINFYLKNIDTNDTNDSNDSNEYLEEENENNDENIIDKNKIIDYYIDHQIDNELKDDIENFNLNL